MLAKTGSIGGITLISPIIVDHSRNIKSKIEEMVQTGVTEQEDRHSKSSA